jgi:hypothetical protein
MQTTTNKYCITVNQQRPKPRENFSGRGRTELPVEVQRWRGKSTCTGNQTHTSVSSSCESIPSSDKNPWQCTNQDGPCWFSKFQIPILKIELRASHVSRIVRINKRRYHRQWDEFEFFYRFPGASPSDLLSPFETLKMTTPARDHTLGNFSGLFEKSAWLYLDKPYYTFAKYARSFWSQTKLLEMSSRQSWSEICSLISSVYFFGLSSLGMSALWIESASCWLLAWLLVPWCGWR